MTTDSQMLYLEIHNRYDGRSVFKAGTRYDWYVIRKTPATKPTLVTDELGVSQHMELFSLPFLPNYRAENVFALIAGAGARRCKVIQSYSAYEARRPWVSKTCVVGYDSKQVVVHSTPKAGVRILWTNEFKKDVEYGVRMFGVPKVIFGDSSEKIHNTVVDYDGTFAMTNHSIAIAADTRRDLDELSGFLKSDRFWDVLKSCQWSHHQLDWRLFVLLKDGFWLPSVEIASVVG